MDWLEDAENHITQGTILDGVDWHGIASNGLLGIVLSNACDLEHDKAGYVIVAPLVPALETLSNTREYQTKINNAKENRLTRKEWDAFSNFLTDYIHNKLAGRYFYFAAQPIIDMDPVLVDFQCLLSVPYADFKESLDVGNLQSIAQLKHPYIEQLMSHFVTYIGRVPADRVSLLEEAEAIALLANGITGPKPH